MKKALLFVWEILKVVVLALVIVLPIRYLIFQPFVVRGSSMEPNFQSGDYLIIDEITYRFRDPQRGEVVVFRYPQNPSEKFIKRIIGLPGEKIIFDGMEVEITDKGGKSKILDESKYLTEKTIFTREEFVLEEGEFLVLGDNRPYSFDSRSWGVLPEKNIIGRAIIRMFPPQAMAFGF